MRRGGIWVVRRALAEYLAGQAWQVQPITGAMAAAAGGDFAGENEVAERFARWGAKPG